VSVRDFVLLTLCCAVWGLNLPLTRVVVLDVPPVFTAAVRFAGIALCLSPFLRPFPRQFWLVAAIAMCIGGLHFTLLFLGLASAPASAVAIVGQLGLPMVTILSIIFLGERVRWRRITGMTLAFLGVVVILYDPQSFGLEAGLLFIVASAFIGSVGSILMKRLDPVPALHLQAWVGLLSVPPLLVASLMLEKGQVTALLDGGWFVWGAIAFSVLVVSIFGHSVYYQLLKRHDVTLLAPLTLMTPICAVLIAVALLGEPVTVQLLVGGLMTLAGVALVALRENKSLPASAVAGAKAG
jgi:O-acetylserine/cysteine efflux transporter